MGALEAFINIPAAVKVELSSRARLHRRMYRGNAQQPAFSRAQSALWIQVFRRYRAGSGSDTCPAIEAEYEQRVRRFGYSLADLELVDPAPDMRTWMLPTTAHARRGNGTVLAQD